jgi:RNA polymerase sigma-70 factor (ECF subfamily)
MVSDGEWRQFLADQVRRSSRLWFRLAFNILREPSMAEDACQQALLRAWNNREQLREPNHLTAWMARSVINESFLLLRRRQTERRALDKIARTDRGKGAAGNWWDREAVSSALETLPEPVRAVVVLRVMEGVSGNDVKDLLGCSASQVSRMLHEGLEQLRRVMNDRDVESTEGALS